MSNVTVKVGKSSLFLRPVPTINFSQVVYIAGLNITRLKLSSWGFTREFTRPEREVLEVLVGCGMVG